MYPLLVALLACTSESQVHALNTSWPPAPTYIDEPAPYKTEWFHRPETMPIDILFAIDKSGSMSDDAANLSSNIRTFITILDEANLDYHIGVISTNNDLAVSGVLVNWDYQSFITPDTTDPTAYFTAMNLQAGLEGSGEFGIDAVSMAMDLRLDTNSDFFRKETPLAIITISDEDDQSIYRTPHDLARFLWDWTITNHAPVTYSGIFTMPHTKRECDIVSTESVGFHYLEVVHAIGGLAIDICNADWSQVLSDLAQYASPEYKPEYILKEPADEDTIEVLVHRDQVTLTPTWTFDIEKNSVYLVDLIPEVTDQVEITYQIRQ